MHAFYTQYPIMRPYVGVNYEPGGARSLLLIGESHFFPEKSNLHLCAEDWYRGDVRALSEGEQGWINTAIIIKEAIAEGFRNKAHTIYRNAFVEINRNGPKYPDYRTVGDIIVFYNYFLRPGVFKTSLKVVEEDEIIAEAVFRSVLDEFRPRGIVFLSKLAYRSWQRHATQAIETPLVATPHPGCAHWNRVSKSDGGKRGREILGEFVQNLWRGATSSCASDAGL